MFCCDAPAQIVVGGGGTTGSGNGLGPDTGNVTIDNFYFDLEWDIVNPQKAAPFRKFKSGRYEIEKLSFTWTGQKLSNVGQPAQIRVEIFDRDGDFVDVFTQDFIRSADIILRDGGSKQNYQMLQGVASNYPRKPSGALGSAPFTLVISHRVFLSPTVGVVTVGNNPRSTGFSVQATSRTPADVRFTVLWNNDFHVPEKTPIEKVIAAFVGKNNSGDPANQSMQGVDPFHIWETTDVGINNADSSFGSYSKTKMKLIVPDGYFYDVGNTAGADSRFNFGTWVTVDDPSFQLPNGTSEIVNVFVQGDIKRN